MDLILNGVELAPACLEFNDLVIQRDRLEEQARLAAAGDPEAMDVDEDFLGALEYGMPPADGFGSAHPLAPSQKNSKGARSPCAWGASGRH